MNPCPCGYYNSVLKECVCTPMQIQRYLSKISGPLLDRIDLHVDVPEVKYKELTAAPTANRRFESPNAWRGPGSARSPASTGCGILSNGQMRPGDPAYCNLDEPAQRRLEDAIEKLGLSARAYDRILKVSRTIADLAGRTDRRRPRLRGHPVPLARPQLLRELLSLPSLRVRRGIRVAEASGRREEPENGRTGGREGKDFRVRGSPQSRQTRNR